MNAAVVAVVQGSSCVSDLGLRLHSLLGDKYTNIMTTGNIRH